MTSRLRHLLPAVLLFLAAPLFAGTFTFGGPSTTNNDDSCDIAALPAATLLLPYFEVDLDDLDGETTLFTVTNVADRAQIVRVTLWTDYAYPVVSFNVYLTGYDVQAINLRDVIGAGRIGGEAGTGTSVSPKGGLSRSAGPGHDVVNCGQIPHLTPSMVATIQAAFTLGHIPLPNDGQCDVGNTHDNAVGYATMDVVAQCSNTIPTDDAYFNTDLRYDNVLMGDYQQVNPGQNSAQGGTMVHIRAIPEGGTQATRADNAALQSNFPRTFYERLFPHATLRDARQPLPSTFAGRWISGGGSGFQTFYKIWRELSTRGEAACGITDNEQTFVEMVAFDEAENPFVGDSGATVGTPFPRTLPATSLSHVKDDSIFPHVTNGAIAGWLYMNLDGNDVTPGRADQAWVVTSMRAEGRYSVDMDATALGNGCSPQTPVSGPAPIGPAPNTTP
jgi:hypothetical protein